MALPSNRLKKVKLPSGVSYEMVPEMLAKNGFSAELPSLVANSTLVIQSDIANIDKVPLISSSPSGSVTIDPYKIYNFGTVSQSMTVSLSQTGVTAGYSVEYSFRITAGTGCGITLPSTVKYANGAAPTFTVGHVYEYNISDGYVVVGEFY